MIGITGMNKTQALRRLAAYRQDYLGNAELSHILGVSKACLSNWRRREKVPSPRFQLKMGPVWTRGQIEEFLK